MSTPARKGNGSPGPATTVVRCAIYTRKSTDEGLDRDFSSLDAQREAAENFIQSQRGEGWAVLPERYDDGGFTGANMERPALKRLLGDIDAGKVDALVVYKIDRLSRSLHDFGQLIRTLEARGVTFVSVTQQFNTATSAGRFVLNILSSFAEYEREMISERTRDKVRAARRRGKFTGGFLILGYDRHPKGGRLVVNKVEAERVREIYRLFLERPSLTEVAQELTRRGWTLKRWRTKEGRWYGGGAFDVHTLRRLLTNPTYIGKVHFEGTVYDAEHEAIVDRGTWDRVQALLAAPRKAPRYPSTRSTALLAGILRCSACDAAMTPTFSQKGRTRYRYYLCVKAHRRGWATCPTRSVPAVEIERFVVDQIRAIGRDPDLVARTIEEANRQFAARRSELDADARRLRKALDTAHRALRDALRPVPGNGRPRRRPSLLAEQEAAIQALEDRLAAVQAEQEALGAQRIDPADLRVALEAFVPVWAHLTTPEQARVVQLLVERIDYDGGRGRLAITFRPGGIRLAAAQGSDALVVSA